MDRNKNKNKGKISSFSTKQMKWHFPGAEFGNEGLFRKYTGEPMMPERMPVDSENGKNFRNEQQN